MGRLEYDDVAFAYFGLTVILLITIPYSYYFFRSSFASQGNATLSVEELPTGSLKSLLQNRKKKKSSNKKESSGNSSFAPRSQLEELKVKHALASAAPLEDALNLFNVRSIIKTLVLLLLWGSAYSFLQHCTSEGTEISRFDPYDILDLAHSATDSEIRKKYRKLSVKWHPDQWVLKSPEEQTKAETNFIKIAKAYSALTDESSRENYRLYGNPDGPQPMELSLGLPSFLLAKQNQNVVLLVYIVILVIVIPTAVFMYYTNSKRYSDKFILNETYQALAYLMNANLTAKHIVEVLALAAEFRRLIPLTPENEALFLRMRKVLISKDLIPRKHNPTAGNLFKKWRGSELVNVLIHAHLYRLIPLKIQGKDLATPELQPSLKALDSFHEKFTKEEMILLRGWLDEILLKCPMLLDAMTEIAQMLRSLKLTHRVHALRAGITQAIHPATPNPFLMVPKFDDPANFSVLKKAATKGLNSFMKMKAAIEEKKIQIPDELLESSKRAFGSNDGIRCPEVIAKIGCMEYEDKKTGRIFFDPHFGVDDIITVYVVLNFTGKPLGTDDDPSAQEFDADGSLAVPKSKADLRDFDETFVHAPYFPLFMRETFSLAIGANNNEEHLFGAADVIVDKGIIRKKIMFKPDFKKPATYSFELHLVSKSYVGMHWRQQLKLEVMKQEDIEKAVVHPEDLETEKSPGIFDVFEGAAPEQDSDFELSDDEKEDEQKTKKKSEPTVEQKGKEVKSEKASK